MKPGALYPGHHAACTPDKPAVIFEPSGEVMTYASLDAEANRLARFLASRGLAPGDHICFWLDNELRYPALWWGAHYGGLYYTLISSRLTTAEAAYIVEDSGAKIVVIGQRFHDEHAASLIDAVGSEVDVLTAAEVYEQLLDFSPDPLDLPIEGASMLYSSGTTGRPKAIKQPLTGDPLGTARGATGMASARFGMDQASIYLSPAPLYHGAPYGHVTAALALGATVVVLDRFDPRRFLEAIEKYGVTHTQVVPTMFVRLLALSDDDRNRWDLASLRCIVHAAAPCPVPVKQQMMDWLGPVVHEYYAGTERIGATYCSPEDWLAHPGSVGRATMGAIRIVNDEGQEVPVGVDGGIYFENSPPFSYHNDDEKTRGSFLENGWATYGDIGHLDEDGFLYLTDRKANVIIVGGVNVYPQEAENALIAHPAVMDAAVFGIPHAEYGEEVAAAVQLVDIEQDPADVEAALRAHLGSHLTSVKCPRRYDFRRQLPREPNGKLVKRLLRDEFARSAKG